MRALRAGAPAVLLLAALLVPAPAAAADGEVLRVGAYHNPPLIYRDDRGEIAGICADLLRAAAAAEGWRLEFVYDTWDRLIERLDAGELAVMTAIAFSEERSRRYEFLEESIFTNWGRVYTRPGSDISSFLDLDGRRVAVLTGDIYYTGTGGLVSLVEKFGFACDFVERENYAAVLEAVAGGEAEAGVVNRLFGWKRGADFDVAASPIIFDPIRVSLAFPRSLPASAGRAAAVDRLLARLKADPTSAYYRWIETHLGDRPRQVEILPEWFARLLLGAGGLLLLLLVIAGVSRVEVRRRTADLRASEERNRRFLETVPDMYFRISRAGVFLDCKEAKNVDLLVPAEEILGRGVGEILPPHVAERALAHIEKACRTGATQSFDYWLEMPGGRRSYEARLVPAGSEEVFAVVQDVTSRRRLETRVRHAQKLESLGVLAGGIAHDFNNLLSGILGNAGLALMKLPPDSPARDYVATIEATSLRAAELTGQMLAYSGRGRFRTRPVDLAAVVEEMARLLQTVVSKKAAVTFDLPRDLPAVEGDESQLRQVVMNLMTNASDALEGNEGAVHVAAGIAECDVACLDETYYAGDLKTGPYVTLTVSDSGCGMDRKGRDRIFDPFYTTKTQGRGLGLAVVLGIVRGHGGALRVESGPGKGTTMTVYLPASEKPAETVPAEAAPRDDWRGEGTVLVVDDERVVRDVARTVLEGCGLGVRTAEDGREALELFRRRAGEIDLVLLDMTMPRMGGAEVFGELRAVKPGIRVIFSSGYDDRDVTPLASNDPLVAFIRKPYRPAALVDAVRQALAGD